MHGICRIGIIALGVAHLGDLDRLAHDLLLRLDRRGRGRLGDGLLLDGGLFLDDGLGLDHGLFLDHGLDLAILTGQGIVIKLPGEVGVCGNDALVLAGNVGDMVGIQLKGGCGLLLADVLLDELSLHEIVGGIEGILLGVIHGLDVDGGEAVLLAGASHQLERPLELAGRADLVLEGRVGVLLLAANVASLIHRALKACGVKRQVKLQNAGLCIDLGDLRAAVVEGVGRPADAILGALVGKERVLQLAVIFFDMRLCLNELCLKALAVAGHQIASGLLNEADDALVAREVAILLGVVHVVLVLGVVGVQGLVLLVLQSKLGIVLKLVLLVKRIGGPRKGGNALALGKGLLCGGGVKLAAALQLVLKEVRKLFEEELGGASLLRCLRRCGRSGCGHGNGGLLDDLLDGLGDHLLHDLVGTGAIGKGRILCHGLAADRLRDGDLGHFLGRNGRQNGDRGLLGGLLRKDLLGDFLGHFLGGFLDGFLDGFLGDFLGDLLNGLLYEGRLVRKDGEGLEVSGFGLVRRLLCDRGLGYGSGGCLGLVRHGLAGRGRLDEIVAHEAADDQKDEKHHGKEGRDGRQRGKRGIHGLRNGGHGKRGDQRVGVGRGFVVLLLVGRALLASADHFADENADAGNLSAQHAGERRDEQHKAGVGESVPQYRGNEKLKMQSNSPPFLIFPERARVFVHLEGLAHIFTIYCITSVSNNQYVRLNFFTFFLVFFRVFPRERGQRRRLRT